MTFSSKLAALSSGRDKKAPFKNDVTTGTYVISCPQKAGRNLSGFLLLNVPVTVFGNTLQVTSPGCHTGCANVLCWVPFFVLQNQQVVVV